MMIRVRLSDNASHDLTDFMTSVGFEYKRCTWVFCFTHASRLIHPCKDQSSELRLDLVAMVVGRQRGVGAVVLGGCF